MEYDRLKGKFDEVFRPEQAREGDSFNVQSSSRRQFYFKHGGSFGWV